MVGVGRMEKSIGVGSETGWVLVDSSWEGQRCRREEKRGRKA